MNQDLLAVYWKHLVMINLERTISLFLSLASALIILSSAMLVNHLYLKELQSPSMSKSKTAFTGLIDMLFSSP